ncbi:sulfurtransferase [Kaarinaea lacus]
MIVYCQTHHRSALTYVALKSMGYKNVKGYPGSWSEWGNLTDTPVEL